MHENLLNILSDSNKDIDNQKLMDYISGRLSEEEKHEVEKWMLDNPFFDEAVEGLQEVNNENKVHASVEHINRQLRKYLQQKKVKRNARILPANFWTYIAVVFILLIAILAYLVIRSMH